MSLKGHTQKPFGRLTFKLKKEKIQSQKGNYENTEQR